MRASRQTEGSSTSAVTHGSPVTSLRRRRRPCSRDFGPPSRCIGSYSARVGAPMEEVKGGGAAGRVPGISPTCLTALEGGPGSGTVPEPPKSPQSCCRRPRVSRNGTFFPPSKLTPLRSLPALRLHDQQVPTLQFAKCAVSLCPSRSRVLTRLYLGWGDCSFHPCLKNKHDEKKTKPHKAVPRLIRTYLGGGGGGWAAKGVHRRQVLRLGRG